jgi:hypothetical protein
MTAPASTVLRGQDQPTVIFSALRPVPAFYVSDWVATGQLSGEAHLVPAPEAPIDATVIRSVLADVRLTSVEKMARISPRVLFGCEAAEEAVKHLTMAATVGQTATVDGESDMTAGENRAWWKGYAAGREDATPAPGGPVSLRELLGGFVAQFKAWRLLSRVQKVVDDNRLTARQKIAKLGVAGRRWGGDQR